MKALTSLSIGAAATAAALSVSPASAQRYDYRYDRDRDVVEEVVDGVARVAGAVAAVTQAYGDPRYGYGYGRGAERYAADACAYEAQRRYARRYDSVGVDIHDVEWTRRDRLRVFGAVELGDRWSRYDRYDRYDRYGRPGRFDRRIAFSCTVRPNGRVTNFRTHRYRW